MPSRTSWKQCNGNMLDQVEMLESESWNGFIRGENSAYTFVLIRASDTRPWVIRDVNKKVEQSQDVWNDRKTLLADLVLAPRTPILPQVFQSGGFKCVNVAPEPTNGEELVRVTFTFSPEGVNRLRGGWVVLDPSHYWVIRSGEVNLDLGDQKEGTAKWTMHNEYKEGSDRHPIKTRGVMKGKIWEKGRLVSEQEYSAEEDLHERASIPESEFTLSAFGLPEPSWAQPKRTRWYLWVGLAGVLCFVVSGVILHRMKRRAAGVAHSP